MNDILSLDYNIDDLEQKLKIEEFLQSFITVRLYRGMSTNEIQDDWKQKMATLDGLKALPAKDGLETPYQITLQKWIAGEKLRAYIISNRMRLQYSADDIKQALEKKLSS